MNTQLLSKICAHIPDKAISACKTEIYTSNMWIRNALKQNLELCKLMATHQNNLHLFSTVEQQNFSNLQNTRFLYDSAYVFQHKQQGISKSN